jgi:hypothetical protein
MSMLRAAVLLAFASTACSDDSGATPDLSTCSAHSIWRADGTKSQRCRAVVGAERRRTEGVLARQEPGDRTGRCLVRRAGQLGLVRGRAVLGWTVALERVGCRAANGGAHHPCEVHVSDRPGRWTTRATSCWSTAYVFSLSHETWTVAL